MCIFGSPKPPAVPPLPPPLPPPPPPPSTPTAADPAVAAARLRQRQRAALAGGRQSTITTSGLGLLTPAGTAKKTILGV